MNVLVISYAQDVIRLISKALSDKVVVEHTETVSTAIQIHKQNPFDLIFTDLNHLQAEISTDNFSETIQPFKKSNPHVKLVVLSSKKDIRKAVLAIKNGAEDYLTHPIDEEEVRLVFTSIGNMRVKDLELDYLRDRFWKTDWMDIIRSRNPVMREIFQHIRSVAPTIATVLLLGETGTGKGLLAQLIHRHSLRNEKPFIAIHCGAIPDTLLESELFGHEKGAFTGADRKKLGKFEMARGGTIFLDEIGTITTPAQIKLLQVLQDGTFSRVGGTEQLNTDARIIAATNADLKQLTEKGLFRKDLYYRLNIFPIEIPTLRDRLEDLPYIIDMFLSNLNAKYGKGINRLHPAVKEGFKTYDWPGNIRELQNILERAYILENSDMLDLQNFPPDLVLITPYIETLPDKEELSLTQARQIATQEFERSYLKKLLKQCKGKIDLSAKKAQITTRQLNRLMTRHGIRKNDFKV
ncbi:MAG: sigma-54-dependent Fis family transcriptional regulator [Desulfobacterales bacterium]|uniref:Sigma-54-dependent Fis family transcriptional regulator n=1 Tax=Candidatus Desulfatibia vada TaxID=2841696 RepID=A0A8J6TT90_9BACT|nr:sigma-54-dependent Fis family transcriptional regulator [Candidatus Desulfatibia vada]MBL6971705.1 sigma-54-dependent Fis family transcriptional regulator [Desulfobacterales bacterium]